MDRLQGHLTAFGLMFGGGMLAGIGSLGSLLTIGGVL